MKKILTILVITLVIFDLSASFGSCRVLKLKEKVYDGLNSKEVLEIFSDQGISLKLVKKTSFFESFNFKFKNGYDDIYVILVGKSHGKFKYISLRVHYVPDVGHVPLSALNKWNRRHLLLNLMISEQGELVIKSDFCLCGVTRRFISKNLEIFLKNINKAIDFLLKNSM